MKPQDKCKRFQVSLEKKIHQKKNNIVTTFSAFISLKFQRNMPLTMINYLPAFRKLIVIFFFFVLLPFSSSYLLCNLKLKVLKAARKVKWQHKKRPFKFI